MTEVLLALLTCAVLASVAAAFVLIARVTDPEARAVRTRQRSHEQLIREACADLDGEYRRLTART